MSDDNPFSEMFKRPMPAPIDPEVLAVKLRDALALWQSPHVFKVGDVIKHRPGIIGSTSTALRLIVVAVYSDERDKGPTDTGHPAGGRPDLLLGYYDQDDDFELAYADSRKYEPVGERPFNKC